MRPLPLAGSLGRRMKKSAAYSTLPRSLTGALSISAMFLLPAALGSTSPKAAPSASGSMALISIEVIMPWRLVSLRPHHLILRRSRSGRLEGWAPVSLLPILRDATLRAAPQDEVVRLHAPLHGGGKFN